MAFALTSPIEILDQSFNQTQRLDSFAHTNTILNLRQEQDPIVLHFWTLNQTVVLGMQDLKVPNLPAGLAALRNRGYTYFVRNSGGLGVVCDQDVLNLSLFLPNQAELTITAAYQLMTAFIEASFPNASIAHYEVRQSYCPGRFDLSINGKKFAGMAQRRNRAGIVVMLYLSVNGNQTARGEAMAAFYQAGLSQTQAHFHFPVVEPTSMANLSDLLARPLTIDLVKQTILNSLAQQNLAVNTTHLPALLASETYHQRYQLELKQLQQRNQQLA
ncbi:lipoate--protein ligase family protein [Lacticaseibacillus brantae]|uniref:Lipoate-protein ligase A n=1 Tax=Lacticaseibacillus brantae DSM 23927 TaxID=1423727 RepID=A0A0R2B5H6_9LACO|nr:hypothetical protein [Lacticaseibacillus brantae]KRM71270.1 lipoate-protein ligase A [Lacticaseibacillus brantae DSM 23927]